MMITDQNRTFFIVCYKFMPCSLTHMMITNQECGEETTWVGYNSYMEHISKGL
jgi:hypothetical protein